jgi:hypothetical protein
MIMKSVVTKFIHRCGLCGLRHSRQHARGRRGLAHLDLHGFFKAAIKSASRAIEPCLAAASLAVACLALLYLPHWFGAQFQDGPSLHPPGRSLVPLPSRLVQAFRRR